MMGNDLKNPLPMDKNDKIIFGFVITFVIQTIPTWFHLGWYWFDLSTAVIIASLMLCLSFIVKVFFLEKFLIFAYYIKLTNIISLYAAYGNSTYLDLLNTSKPILNIVLYLWLLISFTRYVKGWEYK